VIRSVNRQWCNVIKMIAFQPAIWNLDFQNSMHLCQLMSRVCSCVDLTHSTVVSTLSSVRSLEISHALCRFRRICYCIYTLRNATAKLIISSPLCVRPYVRPQCITYWDNMYKNIPSTHLYLLGNYTWLHVSVTRTIIRPWFLLLHWSNFCMRNSLRSQKVLQGNPY